MASELCMNCFNVKGEYEVCPYCGYVEGTPPEQPHYLTPGTILGNHFIVGTVAGVGGFGITYKCYDTTLGVIVAVKEFYMSGLVNRSPGERRVGLLSGDKKEQYKERLERFRMEAQSMSQFGKAKDIVNVYDYFEENGTAYIVMEYIDGAKLKTYLEQQGPMEPEAAIGTILMIIEAVKKIHSKGIIHCDVSPDNIYIVNEESIKILDFGAAQINDSKTGMADPVIKVGYSPLEQYRNTSRQGFYTDVYAAGAVLYQMLTGSAPIESTEREVEDKLKSPMEAGVKLSPNVDRAVMEALAVRPELRFQSMQQFQDALMNKRIAEYPKEKLRKKRQKRYTIIGISATLAAAVGVAAGLYSTILKPQDRIFDSVIDSPAKITVWVENPDQKTMIEELAQSGFKEGRHPEEDEKLRKMQEQNENVKVEVVVQKNMDQALRNSKKDKKKAMPNMFLSDHVSNLDDYSLVSLEDNYNRLDLDKYVFMSDYQQHFPGMKEMPTGVDTLLLYASEIGYYKSNKLDSSKVQAKEHGSSGIKTVELDTVISGGEAVENNFLNQQLANVQSNVLGSVLLLEKENWRQVFTRKKLPDSDMLTPLSRIQSFRNTAAGPEFKLNCTVDEDGKIVAEEKPKDRIYGSNVLAGAAYRKYMNQAAGRAKNSKNEYANPITDYSVYVVTHGGKMLVSYSERYAILTRGSEEQQNACMRLLWVMQQEIGQARKTGTILTTYPIWKASFEQFPSYNAGYGDFIELEKENYPCVLMGRESGQAQEYVDGLKEKEDMKELQIYSEEYVKAGGKSEAEQE